MRAAAALGWLWGALLAAGSSPPRLRLPYRGEPGRGERVGIVAGGMMGWGSHLAAAPGILGGLWGLWNRGEERGWRGAALVPSAGWGNRGTVLGAQ